MAQMHRQNTQHKYIMTQATKSVKLEEKKQMFRSDKFIIAAFIFIFGSGMLCVWEILLPARVESPEKSKAILADFELWCAVKNGSWKIYWLKQMYLLIIDDKDWLKFYLNTS